MLTESLVRNGIEYTTISIAPGERSKSLSVAARIFSRMIDAGVKRRSILLAFGGGMVNDTGGFVAATFMRGIPYVNIPTSLLSQVDSSIGGKVAVNHSAGKNLLGAFYHPIGVYTDPGALTTLPTRDLRSGLAEAIKTAIIGEPVLFDFIDKNLKSILSKDVGLLTRLVTETVKLKMSLLEPDPYEVDLRRPLNFGHTIGHAVERVESFRGIRHGEAVAVGMAIATQIGLQRGLCSPETAERIITLLERVGLPVTTSVSDSLLAEAVGVIRMVRNGVVNFVMPADIGKVHIVPDIEITEVIRANLALKDRYTKTVGRIS